MSAPFIQLEYFGIRFLMLTFGLIFQLDVQAQSWNLSKAIESAQEFSPKLAASIARQAATESQAKAAGIWGDLMVNGGVFIAPVETRTGPQQAVLGLMQPLSLYGAPHAEESLQRQQLNTAQIQSSYIADQVTFAVEQRWWQWQQEQRIASITEMQIIWLEKQQMLLKSSYVTGKADALSLTLFELQLSQQRSKNNASNLRSRAILDQLHLLTGDSSWTPTPSTFQEPITQDFWKWEKVDSLSFYPVQIAESAASEANLATNLERIRVKPQLSAGLQYFAIGPLPGESSSFSNDALLPSVKVNIPLQQGKKQASVQRSVQLEEAAQHALSQSKLQVASQLIELKQNLSLAEIAFQESTEQLRWMENVLELAEKAYTADAAELELILRLEQQQLDLEIQQVNALTQAHIIRAYLNQLQ